MNWPLWIAVFVSLAAPVGILTFDRGLDIPARVLFKVWGLPSLILFAGSVLYALFTHDPIFSLVLWGFVGGIVATAALDVVRLIGVRLGAFPADMPTLFGLISMGLAPALQRNVMAQMVAHLATLPENQRRMMMKARLRAIARLPKALRVNVIAAMQRGLARLSEEQRQSVMATQMALMTELPAEERRALMAAMDEAMAGNVQQVYAQPRGMPKLPMSLARAFMDKAIPETVREARVGWGQVRLRGYLWHFIIGSTFGMAFTLLFGSGSWPLAFAWGVFVWASMMIAMPPMMPMVQFPWAWFPIIPLIAHLAMAVPIGYFAQFASTAAGSSLLRVLGVL